MTEKSEVRGMWDEKKSGESNFEEPIVFEAWYINSARQKDKKRNQWGGELNFEARS